MNKNMKSEELLKEVHGFLSVNLLDYIEKLDRKYNKYFLPPEEGIYLLNRVEPIIKAGQKCYTAQGIKNNQPITNLSDIENDVFDENGVIIIPAFLMKRKSKNLSNVPNLPVNAIKIAYLLIDEYIDSLLPYTDARDWESLYKSYLTPEGIVLWKEGYLESAVSGLVNEIGRFISIDIWNYYFIELRNFDMMVTKSCDFRIHDWTLIQEERREIIKQKEEEAKIT